jgi:hypothetical protein
MTQHLEDTAWRHLVFLSPPCTSAATPAGVEGVEGRERLECVQRRLAAVLALDDDSGSEVVGLYGQVGREVLANAPYIKVSTHTHTLVSPRRLTYGDVWGVTYGV